jgi:predicted dehydrogenase
MLDRPAPGMQAFGRRPRERLDPAAPPFGVAPARGERLFEQRPGGADRGVLLPMHVPARFGLRLGLGPHRERDAAHLSGGSGRPDWFYDISTFGGILNDIASHQIDQFLWLTGSAKGDVVAATVANFNHPDHPDFQDFGDMMLTSDTAQGYVRVDWFTPQGLPTWGDGRLVITGTEGYIELRKYIDIEGRPGADHLFVADQNGTEYVDCSDVELTFFSDVLADVVNRTNTAIPQDHTFEVSRLSVLAQEKATVRKLF